MMHSYSRKRVAPLVKSMAIYLVVILVIISGLSSKYFNDTSNKAVPVFNVLSNSDSRESGSFLSKFNSKTWQQLLFSHIPGLKETSGRENKPEYDFVNLMLSVLTGVEVNKPKEYLRAEVPVLKMIPEEIDTRDESAPDIISEPPKEEPNINTPKVENNIKSDQPLVAFYCTHSSETYQLTTGVTHLKGKAGAVMEVAAKISGEVENKYGIPTILSEEIHDTSFNKSYVESQKTVKALTSNNNSLRLLFDIHRDSLLPRERTQTEINGLSCAKVLIVVGTDARAQHSKWRENLALARKLAAKMDELYPGLSRGISVKKGRYNQQHHTGALLLEVGSINNTKEEALNSGSLLADVIVDLLNEQQNSPTPQ